jgi:hypothetical protein
LKATAAASASVDAMEDMLRRLTFQSKGPRPRPEVDGPREDGDDDDFGAAGGGRRGSAKATTDTLLSDMDRTLRKFM